MKKTTIRRGLIGLATTACILWAIFEWLARPLSTQGADLDDPSRFIAHGGGGDF